MKTLKQKNSFLKIILGIIFVTTVGFAIYQSTLVQKEKQLIVGTWICDEDNNWKLKFDNNGKCYDYYTDEPTEEFTYTVDSEITPSGLEITFVKLINVNDLNDVIEYDINSLGDDKMTLTTLTPKIDYTHFTKQ